MKRLGLVHLLVLLTVVLAACGADKLESTLGWEVGNIEGISQEKETFSVSDMEGKVWLADFIFTSCNTVCPPMTRNMAKIQDMLKEEGVEAEIVSFSVDPNVDTPGKLKDFAAKYGASFENWTFVTDYTQEEIQSFAKDSFKTLAIKTEGNDQVTHGNSFYLIGPEGKVLKKYNGVQDVPYEQIVEDVKTVKR